MSEFKLTSPVVFIIFNRPDTAIKVFNEIKKVQPKKLLVIADGPRMNKDGEVDKCRQCREIIDQVDWECEVIKNFSDENLGCKERISTGLNWAFSNVDEAIILEDDCVPDKSFFYFCNMMLNKYKSEEKIMSISGTNLLYGTGLVDKVGNSDYYFSKVGGNWGWATWKRAWNKCDITMKKWKNDKENLLLQKTFKSNTARYWNDIFQRTYHGEIKTWDYQWYYSILSNEGICIMPHGNLIVNIGFNNNATNTIDSNSKFAAMKIVKLGEQIQLEESVYIDKIMDDLMNKNFYSTQSFFHRLIKRLKL